MTTVLVIGGMGRILAVFLTIAVAVLFGTFEPDLVGPVLTRIRAYQHHRPAFAPSRTLHISPTSRGSRGGDYSGPDFRNLQGFELKSAVSIVTDVNPIRIELPAALDTRTRYDFALVLPAPESQENTRSLIIEGIERRFHIVASHETRLRDAYVLTAGQKQPPPSKGFNPMAFKTSTCEMVRGSGPNQNDSKPTPIGRVGSIGMNGTADEFSHFLEGGAEGGLDRPVVNETGLEGEFDFYVAEPAVSPPCEPPANDFVERLRDQTGLVVTEARRNVDTLVFTPTSP
jgi:uncharacterized protein (TIGR03435 family)